LKDVYKKFRWNVIKIDSPFWLKDREDELPCDFEGIIECDENQRHGYRNKIEFSIGKSYGSDDLIVGF